MREVSAGGDPWLQSVEGDLLPRLILSDAPVLRVVAGPGCGKTFGLKRRIQRLLERDSVEPARIYVGTFTRAIAEELADELGQHVVRGVTVSTIHSLALRLLRNHPPAQIGHELRFLLEFEEACMLYDIGLHASEGASLAENRQRLRRLQSEWSERRELTDASFAGAVNRWLRDHHCLQVAEVVPLALRGLESGDIPQGQFDHVIVDEYQDLTAAEQALVELVWSRNGSLVVAGDDDQSIYSFRFNHPGGISDFSDRWDVEDIELPENRRSARDIVSLANTIMAEGGSRKAPMVSTSAESGELRLVHWNSVESEVDGLGHYLRERPYGYLVLVPRRFIGHRLADAIGEDATTSFYQEVLEREVVQERFALASIVANPSDPVATRAWLGFKGDEPRQAPLRNARAYGSAEESGRRGSDLLEGIADGSVRVRGEGQRHVKERAASFAAIRGGLPPETSALLDAIFDPSAADVLLDEEARRWAARDLTLLASAGHTMLDDDAGLSFDQIVTRLRYRIATRAPLGEHPKGRVRIMTLHSAKGLQSERTVLAGMADQVIPGHVDVSDQEQRRLVYVAATRPTVELVLSWPRSVSYADAMRNAIRIDTRSVRTVRGERRVDLSRSRFIPIGFGHPVAGESTLTS